MSGYDSGVETGNESNESHCMSVESLEHSENGQSHDSTSDKLEPPTAESTDPPAGMSFLNVQPLTYQFGYSADYKQEDSAGKLQFGYAAEYNQHDLTGKMRPSFVQKKHDIRWKHVDSYRRVRECLREKRLRIASNTNNVKDVIKFLEDGVDPCAADDRKRTALHFSACKGYTDVAMALLDRGANPNQKDVVGNTPLHLAACTSNIEMVTLLLKAGTDVSALDNSGRTPLHLAQSKLKLLQIDTQCTSNQLKKEILQVVDMMQIYLQRSGKSTEVDLLSTFSSRLHHHQTREEVDLDVKELLFSLSHLNLQKS